MKNLCKIFSIIFVTLILNQNLFAQGEDEVFNRSVDRVPGVENRPSSRAAFYKKKAEADAKKKLAEQQRAAQQNPQPKAKKKIAAAKQFVDQNYVYQNPPKAAKKIGDAQKFAIQQQKLPSAAIPKAQQKIKAAQQFADQVQPKSDMNQLFRQAEADARQYRQEQDVAERNRILDLQRKLFLREELDEEDRANLILISNGFIKVADQQESVQPTPLSTSAPQKPRRAKRVPDSVQQPIPSSRPKKFVLNPELQEINKAVGDFTRQWEERGIDTKDNPDFDREVDEIIAQISAKYMNDSSQ